jgi:hypothetical protein
MFQNWISIQDFVIEHQKDILREAEAARIQEALRKNRQRKPRPAKGADARGSCRECPGQVEAAQAGSA